MKIKEKRAIEKRTVCKETENEKVLLFEKISRYDEHGNEIYFKGSFDETWRTYNDLNLPTSIRSKDKEGKETWSKYEYDENGKEISFEDCYGNFRKATFNDKGDLVYCNEPHREIKYEYDYDDKGRAIYQKDKDCKSGEETECWFDYTNEGDWHYTDEDEITLYADANKTEIIGKYICGLPLYYKDEGKETWITRDKSGREISEHTKDSDGNEFWSKTQYECDENDNVISSKYNDSDGKYDEVNYNDKGEAIHYKFNESETWYEYEYDDNGKIIYFREDTWYYSEGKEPRKTYNEVWYKYDSEGNEIWYKYKDNNTESEETTTYIYYPE